MKPVFEKIPLSKTSFILKEEFFPSYNTFWHTHPELEIAFLPNGFGKLLTGDGIVQLQETEVILFGPNLPHSWYSEETSGKSGGEVRQIIVQFPETLLGTDWLAIEEFQHIKALFKRASYGIRFLKHTRIKICTEIKRMFDCGQFEQILILIRILDIMARSKEYELLSGVSFDDKPSHRDSSKINAVFTYIQEHFKEELSMESVAKFASMNPSAFSRFFKRRTNKTFTEFLNELRISHACRLLLEGQLGITQICYESGYNNISNFNRQFKRIKKVSPQEFQTLFKHEESDAESLT